MSIDPPEHEVKPGSGESSAPLQTRPGVLGNGGGDGRGETTPAPKPTPYLSIGSTLAATAGLTVLTSSAPTPLVARFHRRVLTVPRKPHAALGALALAVAATGVHGLPGAAGSAELVRLDLQEKLHRHLLLPKTSVATHAGPRSGLAAGPEGSESEGTMSCVSPQHYI